MKLVFYSVVLNHHQAPLADEFYTMLGNEYCFVGLVNLRDSKGSAEDFNRRPYLLKAWESPEARTKAMEIARTAEACIFCGVQSLPYMKERLRLGLLSFDASERWLKQGLKNVLSPTISKMILAYYLNGWSHKPLYKLCMSAFAAGDHYRLGMYKGKCYKWGYFTNVGTFNKNEDEKFCEINPIRLMWCARFINWKHPELAINLANRLYVNGYKFSIDIYGDGPLGESMKQKIKNNGLENLVTFHGNVPNQQIRHAMKEHDIFLFTSDRQEGWGAVANEAMSEGCLLIGSDEIGAVPYLVRNDENGLIFKNLDELSLYDKVVWAIEHPEERRNMAAEGARTICDVWSAKNAAKSLLQLIEDLKHGGESSITSGPCSKT